LRISIAAYLFKSSAVHYRGELLGSMTLKITSAADFASREEDDRQTAAGSLK
jgi:hypothetical protein